MGPGTVGSSWPCLHCIFIQPNKNMQWRVYWSSECESAYSRISFCAKGVALCTHCLLFIWRFSVQIFTAAWSGFQLDWFCTAQSAFIGLFTLQSFSLVPVKLWAERLPAPIRVESTGAKWLLQEIVGCSRNTHNVFVSKGMLLHWHFLYHHRHQNCAQNVLVSVTLLCIFVVNHMWYEQVKNVSRCSKFWTRFLDVRTIILIQMSKI